jgi:hypothetical protein
LPTRDAEIKLQYQQNKKKNIILKIRNLEITNVQILINCPILQKYLMAEIKPAFSYPH